MQSIIRASGAGTWAPERKRPGPDPETGTNEELRSDPAAAPASTIPPASSTVMRRETLSLPHLGSPPAHRARSRVISTRSEQVVPAFLVGRDLRLELVGRGGHLLDAGLVHADLLQFCRQVSVDLLDLLPVEI